MVEATWNDAGGLITSGAMYGGLVDTCCSNPLGGRSAFVGDSWGYTASQLNLASLAGQSFRYRFYLGTDSSVDEFGWFVDDVRIYTCLSCTPDIVLNSGGPISGTHTHYACNSITAGTNYWIGSAGNVTMVAPLVIFTNGFSVQSAGELEVSNVVITNGFAERSGGEVEVGIN